MSITYGTEKLESLVPGWPNGHGIGIVLKELVRRAIEAIRAERLVFEAQAKDTPGRSDDLVTSADFAAQRIYEKGLRECFPGIGIIAEENNLIEASRVPGGIYATVDPLDGTKAFGRRQSGGVATQVALVDGSGRVLAAFVGDVNTGEIYGFRPGSQKVHRITDLTFSEKLNELDRTRPLSQQVVLTRTHPIKFKALLQRMMMPLGMGGLFKDIQVDSGSASLTAARLWKGEVGACINEPFRETPWDSSPVVGMYRALGIVPLTIDASGLGVRQVDIRLSERPSDRDYPLLWVHQSKLDEIDEWCRSTR